MVKSSEIDGVTVPGATIDALNRTLHSVEQLEAQLPEFLSLSDPQLLEQMPLLERAHSLFSLAKLTSTLFSLKLRCRGVNPYDHPFKSELDRISKLQKKLECLPRLSQAQRQDMRTTSEEQAGHKRKYPLSEEQSIQTGAKEFLERETREHRVDNGGSSKEAIVIDISDDDDD